MLPSASLGAAGGRDGQGHPPICSVKHPEWTHPSIHLSEGWGASSHHSTGLEALGLAKVPKKPRESEPRLSSQAKSFLTGNLPSVKTKSESKES